MPWKVENKFRVILGGNMYQDMEHIITYKGESLFRLRRSDDGTLGIDFDVFDSEGKRIAKVAKNIVVYGEPTNYTITTGHETYSVTENGSGREILRVKRRGVSGAALEVHARMYMPDKYLLELSPTGTNLRGLQMTGNSFDGYGHGTAIALD